jgi:hypothetical protein
MRGLELLVEDREGRSQTNLNAGEYAHLRNKFLVIWMLDFYQPGNIQPSA